MRCRRLKHRGIGGRACVRYGALASWYIRRQDFGSGFYYFSTFAIGRFVVGKNIFAVSSAILMLAASRGELRAQEAPEMPKPTAEHKLLEQFAGKWTSEAKMEIAGQDPMVFKGTETARMIGGFWLVVEGRAEEGESMITLGYDAAKKAYVGSFVCSAQDYKWDYVGKFDKSGKKLTLETVGPSMLDPKKTAKYQETMELVDADHKTFTSSIEGADGKWEPIVKVTYERVK